MTLAKWGVCAALPFAILIIAGCAHPIRGNGQFDPQAGQKPTASARSAPVPVPVPLPAVYRGRLALTVDANAAQAAESARAQSFSAAFELSGNPQTGELALFTPLGGTIAVLNWAPAVARLRANNEVRDFDSLSALLKHATGAEIPVAALFSWLAGDKVPAEGWQLDLSQFASGRLFAKRSFPLPPLELRVILDN